jgi:uronate dehydrogenase
MTLYNRILMTGAAGGLGKAMREKLSANCAILRLSDIAPLENPAPHEELVQCDLSDREKVAALCEGVQAIVHFGGVSIERPFDEVLPANIIGMYNLYEGARKHGVKRIIFASSNHVMGFYKQSETIDALTPPRPDGIYGLSKAFGEDISRLYFDKYAIETVCVRIGSCFPEPSNRRNMASYLSYADLYRLLTACLQAPIVGHTILYGVSDNHAKWYDNRLALHIGYRPQDSSEPHRARIFANTPEPDLQDFGVIYQGGDFTKIDIT